MNLSGSFGSYNFGPGSGGAAVNGVSGLEDSAQPGQSTDRPRRIGVSRGQDTRAPRTIAYRFAIFGATVAAYETAKATFAAAFPEGGPEQELLFDDSEKLVYAYVDSLVIPVDAEIQQRHGIAEVVLIASDPTIYEAEATVVVDDNTTLTVAGTRDTRNWSCTFSGACTGCKLVYGSAPNTVTIDLPDSSVPSGWSLVIDGYGGEMFPHGRIYYVEDGEDILNEDYITGTAVDADGNLARLLPFTAGSLPVIATVATGTPTVTFEYRGAL